MQLFFGPLNRRPVYYTLAILFFAVAGSAQEPLFKGPEATVALPQFSSIDRFEFVGGHGEQTNDFSLALQWDVAQRAYKKWRLDLYVAANYAKVDNPTLKTKAGGDRASKLSDFGLTPVIRLSPELSAMVLRPFIEIGIGLHYLNRTDVGPKTFSTRFQFGDHIGIGTRFGQGHRYSMAYRFQHFSNAGIDAPNPGINFHQLSMGIRLGR